MTRDLQNKADNGQPITIRRVQLELVAGRMRVAVLNVCRPFVRPSTIITYHIQEAGWKDRDGRCKKEPRACDRVAIIEPIETCHKIGKRLWQKKRTIDRYTNIMNKTQDGGRSHSAQALKIN